MKVITQFIIPCGSGGNCKTPPLHKRANGSKRVSLGYVPIKAGQGERIAPLIKECPITQKSMIKLILRLHKLVAINAFDIYLLCRSNAHAADRANIFACA